MVPVVSKVSTRSKYSPYYYSGSIFGGITLVPNNFWNYFPKKEDVPTLFENNRRLILKESPCVLADTYTKIRLRIIIVHNFIIIISCRRPEVGETFLLQRPASRAHHAVLQAHTAVRPVPGTRRHHNGRVHANGVTAVGLARPGKRAGQQGCESDEEQEKSTYPTHL